MLQYIGENLLKVKRTRRIRQLEILPGLVHRSTSFKGSFTDFQRTKRYKTNDISLPGKPRNVKSQF